ncbi:MAG: hypothetical protein ABI234_16330 [Ktedonobacteraceae bacterium]
MKINDNGDFCLLYVEPTDEKQSLLETVGMQTKPVVLVLLLEPGQSRPRLFQRPEDFSDLKHVHRQTGVSVIFLTSGSERLAQMAARYGFPAYPSIDAFADFLAHGHRLAGETSDTNAHTITQRRARTGPLLPSAMQIAALRQSVPTGPLHAPSSASPWSGAAALAVESVAARTAPLNESAGIVFWPTPENASAPLANGHTTSPQMRVNGHYTPAPPTREAAGEPPAYQGEIPPRRSALLPNEQYTRHPDWEPEEYYPVAQPQEHPQPARYDYAPQAFPAYAQPARPSVSRSAPDLPAYPARTSATHSAPDLPAQSRRGATIRPATDFPAPPAPVRSSTRKRRSLAPVLILLSLLILGGAGLGSFIVISRAAPVVPVVVRPIGSITFVSSEQLNQTTTQGIDDQVQITLHNLGTSVSGKSYYAWLLGDASLAESQSILLGKLTVVNGNVNMLYPGDAEHTNLLQIGSRFLITEEDSTITPLLPSPDTSSWRYYGALPAIPDLSDKHHFAFVDHLRHLLADEPILDEMELPGGLNNWFTLNTQKLVEWTGSARDQWQESSTHSVVSVRNEAISVLSYLDGMSFMPTDMPPASQNVPVHLDTHLAGLGLLNVRGPSQNPPSYMDQIIYHLNGLLNAPGSPPNVRTTAAALLPSMSSVTTWLQNLRTDDKQLLAMTDAQLGQPAAFSLLDDMALQASNAYTGNTDPSTGQLKQGVAWIHQQLQSIATIVVSTYTVGGAVPELGPSSHNASTFAPTLLDVRRPL